MPALALTWLLIGGWGYAAQAENFEDWALPIECGQALEAGTQDGLRCLKFRLDDAVGDYAAHLIEEQGQALLGENFSFVHRLSWSPYSPTTTRNLDAVFPLNFASSGPNLKTGDTALFLQHGVTRWQDDSGFMRNDIRQGVAYRFAPQDSDVTTNIVGVAVFYQENLERKHRSLVLSMDYAGRYGSGRLQHFVPASDWQPGRSGYEERPIGGTEIGANLGITSTLSLDMALSRWDVESTNARDIHGRVGLGLRPHPWLSIRAGYETGFAGEVANAHVQLTIPLGGVSKPVPRWEGLGALGVVSTSSDIWRPVESVEQLRTVERAISPAAQARAGNIKVAFLQDEAASGSSVGVRVSIPTPLPKDFRLLLRLVPGSGGNPAVPGEDFVDEPQEVTILQGQVSTTAHFQLLHNADLQTNRRLAIMVSLAG